MLVQMDIRNVISMAFRQIGKFMLVFVPIMMMGVLYVLLKPPSYESTAKILVKFGQDARPEMSVDVRNGALSAEEKRGLVQSNVNILTSRDVGKILIDRVGINRVYPELLSEESIDPALRVDIALKKLSKDIGTKTESDSGLIIVSVLNRDPVTASMMLEQLIDIYTEKQAEIYGNPQIAFLQEQATEARKRLEEANHALNEYKIMSGISSLDEELSLLLQQKGDLTGYLSRRSTSVAEAEPAPNAIEPAAGNEGSAASGVGALPAHIGKSGDSARFPVVEDIQKKIDDLKSREAELLLTYKPNSVVIKNIRKNIQTETASLEKSLGALNEQIADLDRQIAEKQGNRSVYDDLVRQVSLSEESYKVAQNRLQIAEVNNDLNLRKITRVSVIEEPSVPYKPSKPNKAVILALCLIVGSAFGAAFSLGAEMFDSTFTSPEQMKAVLGKPVVGALKKAHSRKQDTRDGMAGLYQGLESLMPDLKSHIITITGIEGENSSREIAHRLADFVADRWQKAVLVIENGTTKKQSLIDALCKQNKISEAIDPPDSKTPYSRLTAFRNGEEHLIHQKIDELESVFAKMRQNFSFVILVEPSNPLIRLCDSSVLVIEAETTRAPVASRAIETCEKLGARKVGLILNNQRHYIPDWLYKRLS